MIRTNPGRPFSQRRRKRFRTALLSATSFQKRYTLFFISIAFFIAVIGGGTTLYLLNHNYDLLIKTGLLSYPKLVDNMERELLFANQTLIAIFVGLTVFLVFACVRFNHKIIAPIVIIQNHMRELARGNLPGAQVKLRKTDEFLDFADSYNYLVACLRSQTFEDMRRIEELKPDARNRDAMIIWEKLIAEKKEQVGVTTSISVNPEMTSASVDPVPASRHVS